MVVSIDGTPPVRISGQIDKIDRLPGGGIEVIDDNTSSISGQKGVDESLQLSIYALACRDAPGPGMEERVTLYYTELDSRMPAPRTDEQLDRARGAAGLRPHDPRPRVHRHAGAPLRAVDDRAMCPGQETIGGQHAAAR